jgi:hypothetical protein
MTMSGDGFINFSVLAEYRVHDPTTVQALLGGHGDLRDDKRLAKCVSPASCFSNMHFSI